jgi:protein tyrosine/serine phosphatase
MTPTRRKLKLGILAVAATVAGLVAGVGGYLGYLHASGNFHTVVTDEVYRSAQVTPERLASYKAEHGIRSVLNLRGAAPGEDWYKAEVDAAADLGLAHVDFAMSASVELTPEDSARLIAVMRDMPKPMLVHCRHGSDRTGLAMALYLAAVTGVDEEVAEGQLSLWFGHFAVPYLSDAYPMDESWERMESGFGYRES